MALATLLGWVVLAAGAPPASLSLRQWSYAVDAPPLNERDADYGEVLSDGQAGRDRAAAWQAEDVLITIDLGGWCEVSGVRVFQHFPTPEFHLDTVDLAYRRAVGWEEIDANRKRLSSDDRIDATWLYEFAPIRCDQLRIAYHNCRQLSLSEIQIVGRRLGQRPMTGWSYTVAGTPRQGLEIAPTALSDGTAVAAGAPVWIGPEVSVDIDLGGWRELYGLTLWEHHARRGEYAQVAVLAEVQGAWIERARLQVPEAIGDCQQQLPLGGLRCQRLRLVYTGVGRVSLSEIELFGRAVTGPSSPSGVANDLPFETGTATTLRERDTDGQPGAEIILENAHVRAIVDPVAGVIRGLRLKPRGVELVDGGQPGCGLLRDRVRVAGVDTEPRYRPTTATAGGTALIILRSVDPEVTKVIALADAGPQLAVRYELPPNAELTVANAAGVVGVGNQYAYPTSRGPQWLNVAPGTPSGPAAPLPAPPRGWSAMTATGGDGLALVAARERLLGLEHRPVPGRATADLVWRLSGGEPLELRVIPFVGLDRVRGVVGGIPIDLEASAVGPRLFASARLLVPAGVPAGEVRAVLASADGDTLRELGAAELTPGSTVPLTLDARDVPRGTWIVRLELSRDGRALGTVEAPITVDQPLLRYTLRPEPQDLGPGPTTTPPPAG